MFTVFLFITAKTGNNPAVVQPTVKKQKQKQKLQYIHAMEYYSAIKNSELLIHTTA